MKELNLLIGVKLEILFILTRYKKYPLKLRGYFDLDFQNYYQVFIVTSVLVPRKVDIGATVLLNFSNASISG